MAHSTVGLTLRRLGLGWLAQLGPRPLSSATSVIVPAK